MLRRKWCLAERIRRPTHQANPRVQLPLNILMIKNNFFPLIFYARIWSKEKPGREQFSLALTNDVQN
jgi:hypothetical protein